MWNFSHLYLIPTPQSRRRKMKWMTNKRTSEKQKNDNKKRSIINYKNRGVESSTLCIGRDVGSSVVGSSDEPTSLFQSTIAALTGKGRRGAVTNVRWSVIVIADNDEWNGIFFNYNIRI